MTLKEKSYEWTLIEIQNKLDYSIWKEMIIEIKATRKVEYKKGNHKENMMIHNLTNF